MSWHNLEAHHHQWKDRCDFYTAENCITFYIFRQSAKFVWLYHPKKSTLNCIEFIAAVSCEESIPRLVCLRGPHRASILHEQCSKSNKMQWGWSKIDKNIQITFYFFFLSFTMSPSATFSFPSSFSLVLFKMNKISWWPFLFAFLLFPVSPFQCTKK